MKDKLAKLWVRHGVRYLVIGGSVYLFELVVIVVAQWLGASDVWAVAISFWLGLLLSFALQKFVAFSDKRMHHKVLVPQAIAFSLLVLWNFGFTVGVTKLLSPIISPLICRTIALGITTLWNFYLYRTRIFKPDVESVY